MDPGRVRRRRPGFAAGLAARGVAAGDRVALVLPNCPELLCGLVRRRVDGRGRGLPRSWRLRRRPRLRRRAQRPAGRGRVRPAAATAGTAMPGRRRSSTSSALGEHRHTLSAVLRGRRAIRVGRAGRPGIDPVHLRDDGAAQGGRLDPGQLPLGRPGRRGPSGARPGRREPPAPAAVPHQRPVLLVPLQPVVGRPGRPRAAVLGVAVLGRLGRYATTWTSVVSFCVRALATQEAPERHAYRGWGTARRSRRRRPPAGCRSSVGSG